MTRFVTSQDELRQFLRGALRDHLGVRRTRAVKQWNFQISSEPGKYGPVTLVPEDGHEGI